MFVIDRSKKLLSRRRKRKLKERKLLQLWAKEKRYQLKILTQTSHLARHLSRLSDFSCAKWKGFSRWLITPSKRKEICQPKAGSHLCKHTNFGSFFFSCPQLAIEILHVAIQRWTFMHQTALIWLFMFSSACSGRREEIRSTVSCETNRNDFKVSANDNAFRIENVELDFFFFVSKRSRFN